MHKTTSPATIVKLESVCHSITDGKHGDCENEEGSGYYFLSAKDVRDGKLQYDGARQITEGDFLETHKRTRLEPLDILISNSGTIGRIALAQDAPLTHRTTFQKSVAIVKPNKEYVYPHYLLYYLLSARDRLINAAGGTAQVNLLLRDLRAFEVAIYPLDLQKKIASILSAYDDLIENNTHRIKILEQMAQAIYREWFVEFRAPGVTLRKATPEEQKVTGKDRFPVGWELQKTADGIWVNPTTKVPKDGEKPFIPMSSLPTDSMLINDIEYRTGNSGSKFKNGDTLFARITPCLENGKTAYVQFLPSDEAVAFGSTEFIVLRSKTLCPELVYLMARSDEFRDNAIKSMTGATGRQRVQEACFDRFFFAHPGDKVISAFAEIVSPMFNAVYVLAQKNANLRQTRDLLLPRLVGGEIAVSGL